MRISGAKNAMRRAVEDLLCRPLTDKEKDLIWGYFEARCAYCDKSIERASRYGHLDHLDCSAAGGRNAIGNRVLACKECNGNEKRETDWQKFLKSKCSDAESFERRREKIEVWQKRFPAATNIVLSEEAKEAKLAVESSITDFGEKFARLRSLIR